MLGRIPPKVAEIYGVVLRAQQAGLAAVRPGAACKSPDAAARTVITSLLREVTTPLPGPDETPGGGRRTLPEMFETETPEPETETPGPETETPEPE